MLRPERYSSRNLKSQCSSIPAASLPPPQRSMPGLLKPDHVSCVKGTGLRNSTASALNKTVAILINPYPIFRRHLTIVSDTHTDQRIAGNFMTMLRLAEALPEYVIFYNGPECGASAPDHLHFQAGNEGFFLSRTISGTEACAERWRLIM